MKKISVINSLFLYKYRAKKTAIVFDKLDISNEEDFCH